jgi:RHS repeat-associated protein
LGQSSAEQIFKPVLAAGYQYKTTVTADTPTAYWPCDDGTGTSCGDATGNGHAASFACVYPNGCSDLPTWASAGLVAGSGSSPTYAGTCCNVGANAASPFGLPATRSVEGIYACSKPSTCGLPTLFDINGTSEVRLGISGQNRIVASSGGMGGTCSVSPTPNLYDGFPHLLDLVDDGTNVRAYIDTLLCFSVNSANASDTSVSCVRVIVLCNNGYSINSGDEVGQVSVYGYALSTTQIAAHFNAAEFLPGSVTNLVAKASTNSASLSWTAPTSPVMWPITSYTVTPVVDGLSSTPITISGAGSGANIPNLPGGASYTFQVQAVNTRGAGAGVTSSAVTIGSPTVGPGNFGTYLLFRGGPGNGQAYSHYGFVSRNNVPALSSWTFEARVWGFTTMATTGSHMAFGWLSGTTSSPSDQNPIAGLDFHIGGSTNNQTYFVWPGGSCTIPSGSDGIPLAFNSSVTTPAHVALTYDGTTVSGYINGTLVPTCSVTAAASLPAGPFGFMDNAGLAQGYFDEIRVSSVARYTSNFTPPTSQFTTDSSTNILWHFNDYAISKLPSTHILSAQTSGNGYAGAIIPSTYRDASGNTNHANTIWSSGPSSVQGNDDWQRPYSLGQGVTVDEITGGESNWLCPCTMSSTARPVNDATGEFYHTFTDFHIPGRVDLDYTHTYSSLRAGTLDPIGPIGYGWTDNFNTYLAFDGSGNATVHEANGSAVLFTFTAPSTYSGPPSEHVTLVKNGDSTFTLTDTGQNQTVFNAAVSNISTLKSMVDRHGGAAYTISVTHNADLTPNVVTDPAGRTLTFNYSTITGFRLVKITDSGSPARTVTLQIGNDSTQPLTYNDLVQVTDVAGGLTKFTYDASHYLQTMTDPNNGVTTNTYDPSTHQVTMQQEPITTRTTTFSYSGGITTITDPKGNVTQEEYLNGILLSRTIGYGTAQAATWTYSFDPAAVGLTADVGPNGETVTTVRDASANVLSETDGLGRTTTYTYNSFREPLTIQDPTLVTTTNVYNGTGDLTSTSRPLVGTSQVQTTTYNRTDAIHPGDVTSMVDADTKTWTYTYDGNGNRTSVRDPLGNLTTYVFNGDSWMTSSGAPNGYVTRQDTFVRTPVTASWGTATDGNVWTKQVGGATYSTTGTQGKIASPSSDSFESLGPVLANDGGEILVRWQVATTSDKAGAILRMSAGAATYYGVHFDAAGHVELFGNWGGSIHTNIGGVQVNYTPGTTQHWFRFRVAGTTLYFKVWADGQSEPANWSGQTTDTNVTGTGFAGLYGNASNSRGVKFDQFSANPYATTTYTYNSFGQRTGLTDPENHTTTWHYDPNQNLDRITDADNNLTTNVYDADNELTQVKRADSPQTTLVTDYNPDATVLDQKDGKGNAIQSYQYDSLAHVTTVTDALSNVTTYVYNAYGNLHSKQDPGGNCAAQTPTGCTTYAYDAANQLTAINYSDGVTPNVSNVAYDGDGQRLGMTDGTGTSSFGWDSLHRMVSYTNGNGAQVQWVYNLRNLAITITYPGSLNATRGYDNAGRWTSVQDWNTNTTTFGYDADSNLTTETFPAASGVVDTFTFNGADQMSAVGSKKGASTLFSAGYMRDSVNQLTSDNSAASGTGSYKYTPLNQVCYAGSSSTSACGSPPSGSIAYIYDPGDNLIQKGSVQQAFNNADELCWTASTSGACATPPSGATTYQYDSRGNRTNVIPNGGQAQTLTYDQASRLTKYAAASTMSYGYNADGLRMCKYAGSSTQPCQAMGNTAFVWDVAGSLPLPVKDGTTIYVYGPGGLPVEQVNGSTTYWFHHDQIGSTRLITDSTGASQATYTYDPYGGLASSTGSITNPFRFTGQYLDVESAFYYLGLRYFDPSTGQFVTLDPLVGGTRSPYAYVNGNPLNNIDPTGQCGPCFLIIALVVIVVVVAKAVFDPGRRGGNNPANDHNSNTGPWQYPNGKPSPTNCASPPGPYEAPPGYQYPCYPIPSPSPERPYCGLPIAPNQPCPSPASSARTSSIRLDNCQAPDTTMSYLATQIKQYD